MMKHLLLLMILALPAMAQWTVITSSTNVNNGHIPLMANFDFLLANKAPTTVPGTTLPSVCTVGDTYMKTDATPGQNWYFCTTTDNWTQQLNSGGGGGSAFQKEFIAAKCQAAAGSLTFNTASTGAPVPDCFIGTNTIYGVAKFSASATNTVYDSFMLPATLSTMSLTIEHVVNSTTTTEDTVWQLQTGCAAHNETGDVTWNTAQTVTAPTLGTAYLKIVSTISSITLTGCAANERLFFKFLRDPAHGSDDGTVAAELLSLTFKG